MRRERDSARKRTKEFQNWSIIFSLIVSVMFSFLSSRDEECLQMVPNIYLYLRVFTYAFALRMGFVLLLYHLGPLPLLPHAKRKKSKCNFEPSIRWTSRLHLPWYLQKHITDDSQHWFCHHIIFHFHLVLNVSALHTATGENLVRRKKKESGEVTSCEAIRWPSDASAGPPQALCRPSDSYPSAIRRLSDGSLCYLTIWIRVFIRCHMSSTSNIDQEDFFWPCGRKDARPQKKNKHKKFLLFGVTMQRSYTVCSDPLRQRSLRTIAFKSAYSVWPKNSLGKAVPKKPCCPHRIRALLQTGMTGIISL